MAANELINFAPGPAKLPREVLLKAQKDLLNHENTGLSVMELSHRSAQFSKIMSAAEADLRELMTIPENYKVLFLQGGGTGQFAAVPLNLLHLKSEHTADYIVTGSWSSKAFKEAQKYGKVRQATPKNDKHVFIPCPSTWKLNPEASYVYYCANETIHGVEFNFIPETNGVPLVCDMSSNILSRPVDVSKFALIFGGAQKNIGCAGVTVVIIREDLIGHPMPTCPVVLDYKTQVGNNSLYNTPPTFSIYIMGLVFRWLKEQGGSKVMEERAIAKAKALYGAVDASNGFYCCPVESSCRSRMNAPFRIGGHEGCEELEKRFVDEAHNMGFVSLKGHRSVGGIRVSMYNAISPNEVEKLVDFMRCFQNKHQ